LPKSIENTHITDNTPVYLSITIPVLHTNLAKNTWKNHKITWLRLDFCPFYRYNISMQLHRKESCHGKLHLSKKT
jgi:hypothetical protein